jgi:hypothetical protein
MEIKINKENFFENTFAVFEKCEEIKGNPDFISFGATEFLEIDCDNVQDNLLNLQYGEIFNYEGEDVMFCKIGNLSVINCICDPEEVEYGCDCDYVEVFGLKIRRKNGSKYWYTEDGVYRQADHWGEIKTCNWVILDDNNQKKITAYCQWKNFLINNNQEINKEIIKKLCEKNKIKFKSK